MKNTVYLFLNTISLAFALVMNYLSGTGAFDGQTVGDVSAMFQNPFTPAGYAFAIWGLIYLLLIGFVVYQFVAYYRFSETREIKQTGIWLALANVANGCWIYAWLNLHLGASVIIIFILLISLIILSVQLRLELWNAPLRIIAFVWWPVTIYLGWVIVASVANVTAFLVSIGWQSEFLSPSGWAILMIALAAIIYLLLIRFRNMREAALVGIWAFVAIAVRHWGQNPDIAWAALSISVILLVSIAQHAWKNRGLPLTPPREGR